MAFVIFALPRSRTYWLSRFLSHGDWTCGHDQARYVRGMDDVRAWLAQDQVGTVETAAAPWWRLAVDARPDLRIATIRRDPDAVIDSLMRVPGVEFDRAILTREIRRLDRKLDQIERHHDCLSVGFEELDQETKCGALFEYCTGEPLDPRWWEALAPLNLQINMRAMVRYAQANKKQIARARATASHEVKALFWKRRRPEIEGVSLQEETFEQFWRDGEKLFREHCVKIGEPPDEYLRKNVPLFRKLAELGALQIVTARSNGRMFGYLTSTLGPSAESEVRRCAQQTAFYASPDIWGLGMRLHHFAVEKLRERGGSWDVLMRAGILGDGPRLGTLYLRSGAEPFGQLYKLEIN